MTPTWERNVEGLRAHAQQKTAATRNRAEAAITLLLREKRTINFKMVAETAQISTAWLYGDEEIKQRITHLRTQQIPQMQSKLSVQVQASNASKDTIIIALRKRVHEQEERIKEQANEIRSLKRQVEVVYGLLHEQSELKMER